MSREDAYRLVQGHAMRAWKEGLNFRDEILADKEIISKVPRKQVEFAFDLPRQLKNVDKIFARVFSSKETGKKTPKKKPTRKMPDLDEVAREHFISGRSRKILKTLGLFDPGTVRSRKILSPFGLQAKYSFQRT